MENSLIKIQGE